MGSTKGVVKLARGPRPTVTLRGARAVKLCGFCQPQHPWPQTPRASMITGPWLCTGGWARPWEAGLDGDLPGLNDKAHTAHQALLPRATLRLMGLSCGFLNPTLSRQEENVPQSQFLESQTT